MIRRLQDHEGHLATRKKIKDFLAAADRYMERRDALCDAAIESNMAVAEVPKCRRWRRKAERLKEEGEAILTDRETCGPHLDNIVIGEERTEGAVSDLGEAIREDDKELAQARQQAREQRLLARASSRLMFAPSPDIDAAEADATREPRSPASATPSASSLAVQTTTIGCGPRPTGRKRWSAGRS